MAEKECSKQCLLCGHPDCVCTTTDPLARALWVECPVCGRYGYSDRAEVGIRESADKVAAVLQERRLKGHPPVFIVLKREGVVENWMTLDEILALYPRSASEMIDRVLVNLAVKAEHPCDRIVLEEKDYPLFFGRRSQWAVDMEGMVHLLTSLTYVEGQRGPQGQISMTLTPAGWKKIEELQRGSIDSKQVFVAMWFDQQMDAVFSDGIKPAIEEGTEYRALRMDLKEHNDKICDQIIAEIRKSRFMVADFTGDRGGVYFEAGFAMGLGIPVIWTVRKDDLDRIHFDTRQYNHIGYETPTELRERLRNRIRATIV